MAGRRSLSHSQVTQGAAEREAVVLFARRPQREAEAKGLAHAVRIFELTWRRVAAAAHDLGVGLVIAGQEWSSSAAAPDGVVIAQRGVDFGERLANAFGDVRAMGFTRVVAVGIDAPCLSSRHLRAAFAGLRGSPLVVGPAPDGGVYLLGLAGAPPAGFEHVRWRSASACDDLLALLPGAVVLPERLVDVDGQNSLRALLPAVAGDAELLGLVSAALSAGVPPRALLRQHSGAVPAWGHLRRRGPPVVLVATD